MKIILFILIFGGIVAAILAERKERNRLTAFFAGAFFGLFAWIYYLFCEKGSAICEKCRKRISAYATICPYCRQEREIVLTKGQKIINKIEEKLKKLE